MGFCRRCGEIVVGARCKCGGSAVAPSVSFNQKAAKQEGTDRWTRTYVSQDKVEERPPTGDASSSKTVETPVAARKFPRPVSTKFNETKLGARVSSHILSSFTQSTPSPIKNASIIKEEEPSSPAADILTGPNTSTLSKAYGSVLQPKETLTSFTCIICADPFPPDATIYPDPANPTTTTRFLCKPCFSTNGGSKGDCASCKRPVLMLATEGGFVENAGRIWHRRCFRCDGCFKDVGDSPMVDLLGRPTCPECFESCLKRPSKDSPSPRRYAGTPDKTERRGNLGGMQGSSREASPAIEELHQMLGIRSRESSPFVERSDSVPEESTGKDGPGSTNSSYQEVNSPNKTPISGMKSKELSNRTGPVSDGSPRGRYERFRATQIKPLRSQGSSPRLDDGVVSEMERRILRKSYTASPILRSVSPATTSTSTSRDSVSFASSTPDLTDFSDATTISSGPSTPPSLSPSGVNVEMFSHITPTKGSNTPSNQSSKATPTQLNLSSPSTPCAKCSKPLFRARGDGKFVTVPEESTKRLPPKSYHVDCFRCAVCDDPFEAEKAGQAVFIRSSSGCCHLRCATPERIVIKPLSITKASSPKANIAPAPKTAPPLVTQFPRFGSGSTCPGCNISVGPMERGVVPGPQGSRWHATCLVCGGKEATRKVKRDPEEPGCGKRLDSAAKTDGEGGVWCRECRLLLPDSPSSPSRQGGPPMRPITPSHTGNIFSRLPAGRGRHDGVVPQSMGTTTIARQFTGMNALTTQLTGSGLSPTRQLTRSPSPVKFSGSGRFPRPKSVIGMRGKSVDEGRGMFLVRQMTGGGQNFGL